MTGDLSQVITFITGAGGASAVMFFWNRSLKEQITELLKDLKSERERNNKFGESLMELVTETKIHLEHAGSEQHPVAQLVRSEHQETRTKIEQIPNAISSVIK